MLVCSLCGKVVENAGSVLGVCRECLLNKWHDVESRIRNVHLKSRQRFHLPEEVPRNSNGRKCKICVLGCSLGPSETGFCGIRKGEPKSFALDGNLRGKFSAYLDPLPTNCVADWVCPGGTGSGYPKFAYERGPEVGYYNLAVFFEACNLNCLFCQNWSFKLAHLRSGWRSVDELVGEINDRTSCVCFFGGDPSPQLPFAFRAIKKMLRQKQGSILRICWETNGMASRPWLDKMLEFSLKTGGCIKVDIKAWSNPVYMAMCGVGNEKVIENVKYLAERFRIRRDPPLVVFSTLLVPEYVTEEEVFQIAKLIASIDPDIPYTLLGFAPQFEMRDFSTTAKAHAESCLDAALSAGLKRVRLANRHLLCGA